MRPRQSDRHRNASRILERKTAVEGFTPNITERKLNDSRRQWDGRDAGEFSDSFALGFERCTNRRKSAVQLESSEGAVDIAPRADAFDDLLAEIAALGEVQSADLAGLLRQVTCGLGVADVGAVKRRAFKDAQIFKGFGIASNRTGV